jgi:CBS domain-containing protein
MSNETTVREMMREPTLVSDDQTLRHVLERMVHEHRNSLAVVDADGKLVGAVNAVDIIQEVVPDYLETDAVSARFADDALLREDAQRVADKCVREFMATDIPTISPDDSMTEAAVLAACHGRGRIVVINEANEPIGILTRTEIKRVIATYLDIPDEDISS